MLEQINEKIFSLEKKFILLIKNIFEKKLKNLQTTQLSHQLIFSRIDIANQKTEFLGKSLLSSSQNLFNKLQNRLENSQKLLKANHYQTIVQRGFALIKNEKGSLISSANELKTADQIAIEMADGEVEAQIKKS